MGIATENGGGASADLGGGGRFLEWIWLPFAFSPGVESSIGGGTYGNMILRSGDIGIGAGDALSSPMMAAGGGGSAGVRGRGYVNYKGIRCHIFGNSGSVDGGAPSDLYCKAPIQILTEKPAARFNYPLGVWEVAIVMATYQPPVGAIAGDVGLVFVQNTSLTGYANSFAADTSQVGFAVIYNNSGLRWYARSTPASAPSESVVFPPLAAPLTDFASVRVRFVGATATREASVKVYVNDVLTLTRNWGAGTVLPTAATFPLGGGAWRVFVRNGDSANKGNVDLVFPYFAVRAATTEAALG